VKPHQFDPTRYPKPQSRPRLSTLVTHHLFNPIRPMQAACCTRYGPPETVQLVDLPTPTPKANEVLIRLHASTVASGDWRLRSGKMPRGFGVISRLVFGLRRLRQPILGTEFCGTITALGPHVTRFKTGDAVIGFPGVAMRCHAEFRTMREDAALALKPAALTDAQAAALCFGGTTALHYLRDKARLQPGQSVLILGGAGSVGSASVQIAKHLGAVVSTTSSAANFDLLRSLGAIRTLDYRTEDFTHAGPLYDVIMDTVGASSFGEACRALRSGGLYLAIAADLSDMLTGLRQGPQGQRQLGGPAPERPADVAWLADLATQGHYLPVIDSVFPLAQIAAAHARVETGHKRGNVVVTMSDTGQD
jgi:NADPH:quinone reductase-like Zn-dependent oxidoreductase